MKRKILHSEHSGRIHILKKLLIRGILAAMLSAVFMGERTEGIVRAAGQTEKTAIEYSYDSLGRVSRVVYPDGKLIIYTYDANGNLLGVEKTTLEEEKQKGESGKPAGGYLPIVYEGHRPFSIQNAQGIVLNLSYTAKDVKNYNKFKKKIPKIKSITCKTSRKKYSLSIRIQQVNARGSYGETGYEIRYSESSKFKSSKKVTVSRRKKGKYTGKSWNVKKGKTYYVKVRAYMKTKTGKKIYTKYSKVKKIKAVK